MLALTYFEHYSDLSHRSQQALRFSDLQVGLPGGNSTNQLTNEMLAFRAAFCYPVGHVHPH
jgi:hypothetical protein